MAVKEKKKEKQTTPQNYLASRSMQKQQICAAFLQGLPKRFVEVTPKPR